MTEIRPAKETDAESIRQIIQDAFDEDANHQRIRDQILHTSRLTLVAECDGAVAGFVDGFRTISREGRSRMELDLIAIAPDHVGQGLGSLLVQEILARIPGDVNYARALVAVGNLAMQKVCERLGFGESVRQSLYVQQADQIKIAAQHVIPVNTLTYAGWWLEGEISSGGTLESPTQKLFGAVVPAGSEAVLLLEEANFAYVKDYHWWTKAL